MNLFLNFVSYPTSAEQLNNKIEYDHMTDMQLLDDGGFVNWNHAEACFHHGEVYFPALNQIFLLLIVRLPVYVLFQPNLNVP